MNQRIMYCSLVLLWLFGIFGIAANGQINHQVKFPSKIMITEKMLDDGVTYAHINAPEMQVMDSVGFPSLPVKYVKLIVPTDAIDLEVIVNSTKSQKYKLRHKVEPLQPPVPTGFYDKLDFVKPDGKKYNSNTPYPASLATIVEDGYFRGNL